jgi:ketosteroid isomerase-like protein
MLRQIPLCACLILLFCFATPNSPYASTQSFDRAAVVAVLDDQKNAWNRGDVTAFMNGYWRSPDVTFAGKTGFTRGWDPVLARYQHSYPDQASMGHLEFSELEVRPLGTDAALVLGKWHIARAAGDVGGIFTLVLQKFPEGWRIIHDHTTANP